MKKKSSRIVALVLTLCMVFFGLPVSAFAADVSTAEALTKAFTEGGEYQLTADIPVGTKQSWVINGKNVVLDLNGHSITSTYAEINNYLIVIQDGGSLTINDSSQDKKGKIAATDNNYGYGIQLRGTGSSFVLNGGTIETTQESVDIYDSARKTSITIAGGKLISTSDSVLGVRGSGTQVNITGGDMTSGGRCGVYISCYGTPDSISFTMTGGTLTHDGGVSGAIQAYKGATLTIGGNAVLTSTNQVVQMQGNTVLNVEGGTISSGGRGYLAVSCSDEAVVNISEGTLTSASKTSPVVRAEDKATVTISGGTFESSSSTAIGVSGSETPTITIKGGNFNKPVDKDYLAPGVEQDNEGNVVLQDNVKFVVDGAGYETLKDALKAAKDGSIIILRENVSLTLEEALKIQKDITIISAGGKQKTITLTNGQEQDRAKMIVMSADLTLDNVALTLMPTAKGNGDGIQMGNALTTPVTLTLKNGAELTFANNSEQSVQNAFVMPAGAGAKVIVDDSQIFAEGVDGNFSNGGIFTIQNGSTVEISNCDSYALNVNGLTVDDSTLTITDTKLSAIRTAGKDSVVSVVNGGEIVVENCGESLPNDSQWSYAVGVIDLGHLNNKDLRVPAILNVDKDSSITLSRNVNSNDEQIDYVYLTNSASYVNDGSVTGIKQEEGLPDNYCSVIYMVKGSKNAEIRAEISSGKITFTEPADPVVSGYRFDGWDYGSVAVTDNKDGTISMTVTSGVTEYTAAAKLTKRPSSSTSDDTPSPGYRLPYISETTGGKNFVSDTTSNLTVNGKYQFRITSTDGHKPVMTVSNANFTVELASQSGNDYFYVIRCAGAAGSTANVLVDGIHVVVATVGTAGVVSDTTHPFTVAQGATYQFKLTSASRPTFTGNNANFTIAYVSNSGNDWFFKVTAVGAAGASTTFSANGVVVTTATIA